jgi:diaminohydroxyphosphoribosylaminopyrimidine deaminase/5-amino-6-(5-phosphoribosylamino)uracil reductase
MSTPLDYMTEALSLAEKGRFTVSPNPMVGCVIVKENQIVGRGFHYFPGESHAEIFALREADEQARNATMYVTLEPCCHYGRTPPCVDEIIRSGIKEIFIAIIDSNPAISGKSMEKLQQAGVIVHLGLQGEKAKQLNEIYFYFRKHHGPFVIAKWAMSLNGKTVVHPSDNKQISGVEAQRHLHYLRNSVDAILIGADTARKDNPLLNVRDVDIEPAYIKHPLKIILSASGEIDKNLRLFSQASPGKTLIVTTSNRHFIGMHSLLDNNQIEVIVLPEIAPGIINLSELLDILGQRGVTSILVEGGEKTHEQFFKQHLVNKIITYLCPLWIGQEIKKQTFVMTDVTRLGRDIYIEYNEERNNV